MNILKMLMSLSSKKHPDAAPLLIIKKDAIAPNVKEYKSIEEAIADLEKDPNVPFDKIKELKTSLDKLKNKTSIKIRNGEIL